MRYLVVRALLFVVPFTVLMIAQVPWWLSLLVSLAFAFAASIVFFGKLRDAAATDLQRLRAGRKRDGAGPDDADIEDAAVEDRDADLEAEGTADEVDQVDEVDERVAGDRPADGTGDGAEPDASGRP